jgi:MFS family permease
MGALSVRYTDRLVMRFGARPLMIAGLALLAAGLALFALAPATAAGGTFAERILPATVLTGAGAGLCFPALMTLAMSTATRRDAGLASGLVNTTAQIGGALGLAVLATVSAARTSALTAQHRPAAQALTDGYHLAFWIAVALVAAAIAVTVAVLRPTRAGLADRHGGEANSSRQRRPSRAARAASQSPSATQMPGSPSAWKRSTRAATGR